MAFYDGVRSTAGNFFKILYRIEGINKEAVPKEGGVLVCANHISLIDPIALAVTTKRHYHFMGKEELFRNKLVGTFLRNLHAFPVKRGASDREALRMGMKVIKDGNILGIFPEGTRSKTGDLGQGHAGSGFFALRTDCTVVPAAIIGPYKLFRKTKVVYGDPIDFTEHRKNKISADEATQMIMDEINRLILNHKN